MLLWLHKSGPSLVRPIPRPVACPALTGRRYPEAVSRRKRNFLAPGERWDVIVDCNNPGTWAFHCHILTHAESEHGMFGMVTALIVQ